MNAPPSQEQSWTVYGQRQLDCGYTPPVPSRLSWGFWAHVGPGAEVLGPIRGKRVLDIGSGAGHHAVHLAQAHNALVTAIECAPTQHQRAIDAHDGTPGVEFVLGDVVDYLADAEPFDAAYAIGTLAYLDPHRVLPALHKGLRDGAPLVFSVLHTDLHDRGPSTTLAPREQHIRLRDTPPLPVQMWVLSTSLWEDLLNEYGFRVENVELLRAPESGNPVIQQLITARRRPRHGGRRVTSRPRTNRPPTPRAALGVGIIVTNHRDEILLGRHHRGTHELPGGTVEAGETLEEAVIRELHEESGLSTTLADVALMGTLVDHVDGVVRVTVAARVHRWSGTAADQPGESIGSWRWTALGHLPDGLFECTAHVLTAWRPDLPIDHPPASLTAYHHPPLAAPQENNA
ncbi:bifunctional class I SAM-dependent methyltransferase/NUDIX hydrolase [Streptomyces sp. NPDC087440]|uniref:bifunctional class I SAM-dependent methyltransferase/NUDIX hydrolase n=1 Tax=Streptomyces sp. NPDC087440 TaxID=3365790 RepID=UPI00382A23C0